MVMVMGVKVKVGRRLLRVGHLISNSHAVRGPSGWWSTTVDGHQ